MVLGHTYPDLVDKAVAAGLQELVDLEDVPEVHGAPLWNGGFSVPKNEMEDRWISPLEWTNDLVDDRLVPKVEFPYLPQLRPLTLKKGQRARVSKRDARRYFHGLSGGTGW